MFSQSACILLNEAISTEQILAVLHKQDLPVILHKQGNDLLTLARSSDVCEVVLRTEQPASILVDCMDHPNSTYLVTEFHHLKDEKGAVPYWFDTIVILSLALCGLLLGSFSLLLVHQMLLIYVPGLVTWIIFIAYLFLSNVGIYIGRFLRFNSWDILTNPLKLVGKMAEIFKVRSTRRQLLLFASLFTIFLLTFYLFLYSAVTPIASGLIFLLQHRGAIK